MKRLLIVPTKIVKQGGSSRLTIPKAIIEAVGIDTDNLPDTVEIVYEGKPNTLILRWRE